MAKILQNNADVQSVLGKIRQSTVQSTKNLSAAMQISWCNVLYQIFHFNNSASIMSTLYRLRQGIKNKQTKSLIRLSGER